MEFKTIEFKTMKEYEIDFNKVKTIEDVVVILKAMNIRIYENYQGFKTFKPYIKEVE